LKGEEGKYTDLMNTLLKLLVPGPRGAGPACHGGRPGGAGKTGKADVQIMKSILALGLALVIVVVLLAKHHRDFQNQMQRERYAILRVSGAEYDRAIHRLRALQLDAYERKHGHAARVRLEDSYNGPGWNLKYDVPGWERATEIETPVP
jgi:hypothetical protein